MPVPTPESSPSNPSHRGQLPRKTPRIQPPLYVFQGKWGKTELIIGLLPFQREFFPYSEQSTAKIFLFIRVKLGVKLKTGVKLKLYGFHPRTQPGQSPNSPAASPPRPTPVTIPAGQFILFSWHPLKSEHNLMSRFRLNLRHTFNNTSTAGEDHTGKPHGRIGLLTRNDQGPHGDHAIQPGA